LAQIREREPLSITALARAERCSQPTMSTAVRALESKEWVRREADPHDARASRISLTPAGTAELDRAHQNIGALVADWLAATDHSTEDVRRAVDVVRAALAASRQPDVED
jgi:DNA-binding MarR family transcriptional regulator